MTRVRSLRVVAVSSLLLAVLIGAEVSQAVAEGFLVREENHMTDLVNAHRAEHGLPPLPQHAALQMVARRQASRMVAAGYIYHNPDLAREAEEAVPRWVRVGENVGVGGSVPDVQNAFLNSPGHHANIHHNGYNLIGLGAVPHSGGALYFTQNFAMGSGGGAPAPGPGAGAGAAGAGAAQNGVVSTCRRRGRRLICPKKKRAARRAARRPARRARRARVRGVEILRPQDRTTPKVTFVGTVTGMLGRAGDQLTWWD